MRQPAAASAPAVASGQSANIPAPVARNLRRRVAALCRLDPEMAELERVAGRLIPRQRPPGFATLVRIVIGQQLSTRAASAIFARLEAAALEAAAGLLSPEFFLETPAPALRALGLSASKAAYCRILAESVRGGALDVESLSELDDEACVAALTAIKGIGRWTAEIYLLFALDRADVWPASDLGLGAAYARLRALPARPSPREMAAIAERWRPHRSTAARLLWHFYDRVRAPL